MDCSPIAEFADSLGIGCGGGVADSHCDEFGSAQLMELTFKNCQVGVYW